jgi:hypothetical protein
MNQDERNKLIEEYGNGYELLTAALTEIPHEAWEFKPASHEWSLHELIVHMADSESIGAVRLRKLIAEPGSTLMTYEDAIWAEALNYQNQSIDDALQLFKLLRQTTYRLLTALSDEAFTFTAVHPEYPESYTMEQWLNVYTGHVRDHIEQLKGTYQAWKDIKR